MTIGVMHQPKLNEPRYSWYQKRYHRRIPKIAESKWWIDAYYTKRDYNSAPVAIGTLGPWAITERTGTQTFATASGFAGTVASYSLATGGTGFSINSTTGVISAMTSIITVGTKSLVVRATNGYGTADQPLTVNVALGAPALNGTLSPWTITQSTGNQTYPTSGGFIGGSLAYSLVSPPGGVTINSSTGVVTADTTVVSLGTQTLTVRATNTAGYADQSLSLTLTSGLAPPATVGTLGPWAVMQLSGNQTFAAASGFTGSGITYSLQVGATGFSINSSTGVITCNTATSGSGTKNLTVRATNLSGFADQPLTVNIAVHSAKFNDKYNSMYMLLLLGDDL